MRICYLPQDFSGSGMYRLIFPLRELEKHGHWAKTPVYRSVGKIGDMEVFQFELDSLPEADIYVFQQPLDLMLVGLVKTLRKHGKLTLGEADDSPIIPEWHPSYSATHRENNPYRNREVRKRIFQSCDALTVSTQALADQYRNVNKRAYVLPNFLLGEIWTNTKPQFRLTGNRVRVGWMGRSHWREGDLEILKPVIRPFLDSHPNVDFVAAGDEKVHEILEIPEDRRITHPSFVFPQGLAETTSTMDIGLVPLELNPFNEAKSCLKGMEYAACGIPCIASPTREYQKWCTDNGVLALTPEDWTGALDYLVTDRLARVEMGRKALIKASQNTIEEHWTKWESLYYDLLGQKHRQGYKKVAHSF